MPLKEDDKRDVDYKARLERKLWLARENPEPIFDLSECNLKTVPSNIYSLCRVFRKEALYLQKNKLNSLGGGGLLEDLVLLTLLDISSNNFAKLPNNINVLKNLKVLNVSMNQLKELPETIGDLKNLLQLDASRNALRNLPMAMGRCRSLEHLNVEGNVELKRLPPSLGKLHHLRDLLIGPEIVYPPPSVCRNGVEAVLEYLSEEYGGDSSPSDAGIESQKDKTNFPQKDSYNVLQERLKMLEKMKEDKQRELLALEEQLLNENKKEIQMQQLLRDNKKELISVLKKQQKSLDVEIMKIQENKESQRALLIKECNSAEEKANLKINQLLAYNNALREKLAKETEKERKEEDDLVLVVQQQLQQERNQNVIKAAEMAALLESMNKLLLEEFKKAEARSDDKRLRGMERLITEDKERFETLRESMKKFDKNQRELLDVISKNEELQKSAVSSLLERSDARLWQIRNQVVSIEAQLATLTQLEMTRRRLETESHLAELSKSRVLLSELLSELFRQQSERRQQLIESLRRIENAKNAGNSDNYWFEQYQKLLLSKSHQLVERLKGLDPDLANEFYLRNILHLLPVLDDAVALSNTADLESLTCQDVARVGITSKDDQAKVLEAIRAYASNRREVPSAPPDVEPSAPYLTPATSFADFKNALGNNEECVICMDSKSDVIFLPCGHVCCCANCSSSISACPLCRTQIKQILRLSSTAE